MARSGPQNQDAKAAQADARVLKAIFDASVAAKSLAGSDAMEAVDIDDLSTDEIAQAHSAPAAPSAKAVSLTEILVKELNAINADARINAYASYLEIAKLFAAQPADLKDHEIRITEITYQPIMEALRNGDITLAAFPTTDNSNDGLTRATAFITQEYTKLLNPEPVASAAAAAPTATAAPALDKWAQAAPVRKAPTGDNASAGAAPAASASTASGTPSATPQKNSGGGGGANPPSGGGDEKKGDTNKNKVSAGAAAAGAKQKSVREILEGLFRATPPVFAKQNPNSYAQNYRDGLLDAKINRDLIDPYANYLVAALHYAQQNHVPEQNLPADVRRQIASRLDNVAKLLPQLDLPTQPETLRRTSAKVIELAVANLKENLEIELGLSPRTAASPVVAADINNFNRHYVAIANAINQGLGSESVARDMQEIPGYLEQLQANLLVGRTLGEALGEVKTEEVARQAARDALSQTFARATDNAAAELQRRADAEAARVRAETEAKARETEELQRQLAELQAEQQRREEEKRVATQQANAKQQAQLEALKRAIGEYKDAATHLQASVNSLNDRSTANDIQNVENEMWRLRNVLPSKLRKDLGATEVSNATLPLEDVMLRFIDTIQIDEQIRGVRKAHTDKAAAAENNRITIGAEVKRVEGLVRLLQRDVADSSSTLQITQKAIERLIQNIHKARGMLVDYPSDIQKSENEVYDRISRALAGYNDIILAAQRRFKDNADRGLQELAAKVVDINNEVRNVPQDAKAVQENTIAQLDARAKVLDQAYADQARRYTEMLDTLPDHVALEYRERVARLDGDKAVARNALNAAIARIPRLIEEAQARVGAEEKILDGIIQTITKAAAANPGPNVDANAVNGYREDLRRLQQEYRSQEERYAAAIGNLPAHLQPKPPHDIASKTKQKDDAVRAFEAGIIAKSEFVVAKAQSYARIQAGIKDFDARDEKAVVQAHRTYVLLSDAYKKEAAVQLPPDLEGHIAIQGIKAQVGYALAAREEELQSAVSKLMSQLTEDISAFLERERPRSSAASAGIASDLFRDVIGLNVLVAELKAMLNENVDLGKIPTKAQVDAISTLLPELESYERKLNLLREVIQSDLYPKSAEFVRVMRVLPTVDQINEILDEARTAILMAEQRFAGHRGELQRILETESLAKQQADFIRQVRNEGNPDNTEKFLRQLQDDDPRRQELEILIRRIDETINEKLKLFAADEKVIHEYAVQLQANVQVLDGLVAHIRQENIIASPAELKAVEDQIVRVQQSRASQPVRRAADPLPNNLAAMQQGAVSTAVESVRQAGAVLGMVRANRAEREAAVGALSLDIARVRQQFEALEFKAEEPSAQMQAKWNHDQHNNALLGIERRAQDLFAGVQPAAPDQKDGVEALRVGVERDLKAAEHALRLKDAEYRGAFEDRRDNEGNVRHIQQGMRDALGALARVQGQWNFADLPEVDGAPAALVLVTEPNPTNDQISASQLAEVEFLEKVEEAGKARLPADLKDEIKATVNQVNLAYAAGNHEKANRDARQKWDRLKNNVRDRWVALDGAITAAQQPVNDLKLHQQNHLAQRQALDAQAFVQKLPLLQARMADEKKIIANEAKQAVLVDAAIAPAMQLLPELPADLMRGMNGDPPALAPKVADAKQINDDGKFYRGVINRNAVADWVDVLNNELDRAIAASDIRHQVVLVDEFKRLNDMRDLAGAAFKDLNEQQPAARAAEYMNGRLALEDEIRRLEDNFRRFEHLAAYQNAFVDDEKERVEEQKALAAGQALVAGRANPDEEKRRAIIRKHIEIPRLQWLLIQRPDLHLGSDESLLYGTLNKTTPPPPGFNAWMRANPNATVAEINGKLKDFFAELRRVGAADFKYQGPVRDFKDNNDREDLVTGANLAAIRAQRVAVNNNYKLFANNPADVKLENPDAIAPGVAQDEKASARHQTKLCDTFVRDLLIQHGLAMRADVTLAQMADIRNFDYRNRPRADLIALIGPFLINRPADDNRIITQAEFEKVKGMFLVDMHMQLTREYERRTNHLRYRLEALKEQGQVLIGLRQHYRMGGVAPAYNHVIQALLVSNGALPNNMSYLELDAIRNFNFVDQNPKQPTDQDFNVWLQAHPNATAEQLNEEILRRQFSALFSVDFRNQNPHITQAIIDRVFGEARAIALAPPELDHQPLRDTHALLAATIDDNATKLATLREEFVALQTTYAEFQRLNNLAPTLLGCRENIEGVLHIPQQFAANAANLASITEARFALLSPADKLVYRLQTSAAKLAECNNAIRVIDESADKLAIFRQEVPEEQIRASEQVTYYTKYAEVLPLSQLDDQLEKYIGRGGVPPVANLDFDAKHEQREKLTRRLGNESEARFSAVKLGEDKQGDVNAMFVERLATDTTSSKIKQVRSEAYVSDGMRIGGILLNSEHVVREMSPVFIFRRAALNNMQQQAFCFALDNWLSSAGYSPSVERIEEFFKAVRADANILKIQPEFAAFVKGSLPPGATPARTQSAIQEAANACQKYIKNESISSLANVFNDAITKEIRMQRVWQGVFSFNFGVQGSDGFSFRPGYEYIPCDKIIKMAETYLRNLGAHYQDVTKITVSNIMNPALIEGIQFAIRAENLKRELLKTPRLDWELIGYPKPKEPSHAAVGYYAKHFKEKLAPTMDERFTSEYVQTPLQAEVARRDLSDKYTEIRARVNAPNSQPLEVGQLPVNMPRRPRN